MIEEDDKLFTMYTQYKALIHKNAVKNENRVYGVDQLAAWLTVGHTLDNMASLLKETKIFGTATNLDKVNDTWKIAAIGQRPKTSTTKRLHREEQV